MRLMAGIFVSHTKADQPIVQAMSTLIGDLFGKRVPVNYSSSKELDGGIAPGADWFNWIVDQVRSADLALIVLTPTSIQRPWVVWEAGAVAGAAYATAKTAARQTSGDALGAERTEDRRVCPITFGLSNDDVPSPFARTQLVKGTDPAEVKHLTQDLLRRFAPLLNDEDKINFGEQRRDAEQRYFKTLEVVLGKLPHTITEDAVQEWLQRLDELESEGRYSEVAVLESWLDVAFGREESDRARPIDVRIHRRLGDLFARAGSRADAARQYELARLLSPRDIYLLRRLGKAYLDGGDVTATKKIIDDIAVLDPHAFVRNIETAALKARWCENTGDVLTAIQVLKAAYETIPTSYYLGDRLGQLLLDKGDRAQALDIYRQVLANLTKLAEHNVWTNATGLTAAVAVGDAAVAESYLAELRKLRPSREQRTSIARGLGHVAECVGADHKIVERVQRLAD